eukprot:gene2805-biopygen2050
MMCATRAAAGEMAVQWEAAYVAGKSNGQGSERAAGSVQGNGKRVAANCGAFGAAGVSAAPTLWRLRRNRVHSIKITSGNVEESINLPAPLRRHFARVARPYAATIPAFVDKGGVVDAMRRGDGDCRGRRCLRATQADLPTSVRNGAVSRPVHELAGGDTNSCRARSSRVCLASDGELVVAGFGVERHNAERAALQRLDLALLAGQGACAVLGGGARRKLVCSYRVLLFLERLWGALTEYTPICCKPPPSTHPSFCGGGRGITK